MIYFIVEGQTDKELIKNILAPKIEKDIDNKAKLYAYTTLEHNKKPEQYIKELNVGTEFDHLKQKLQTLFEGTK